MTEPTLAEPPAPDAGSADETSAARWLAIAGRALIADMALWMLAATWLVLTYSNAGDGSDTGAATDLVAGVSVLLWLFAAALGSLGTVVGLGMINDREWAPVAATWLGGAYAALVVGMVLAAELKLSPVVIVVSASQLLVLFGTAVVATAVAAARYDGTPPADLANPDSGSTSSESMPAGPPFR